MNTNINSNQTIIVLVTDLFFSVKIGNELRQHYYRPIFVKNTVQLASKLGEHMPALVIIDASANVDWAQVAQLQVDSVDGPPIIAFGPHKDVELLRAAKAAGVTRVVSNSQFHADALSYVQRYARQS